jgi:hypothetical protein
MARRKRKGPGKREVRRKAKLPRKNQRKYRKAPRRAAHRRRAVTTRRKAKRGQQRTKLDARFELAVRQLNRGRSISATARVFGLSVKNFRGQLARKRLLKRKGTRWITQDDRLRRVTVMTGGRFRTLIVRGYKQARLIGEHHHAAGQFVRTNEVGVIKRFKGRTVQAANGRRYVLETDPNTLHRIAAIDSPQFHEIYAITSST